MASEMLQFAAFLGAVGLAFVVWLNVIYLPGRTLERRYDAGEGSSSHRTSSRYAGRASGGEGRPPEESYPELQ